MIGQEFSAKLHKVKAGTTKLGKREVVVLEATLHLAIDDPGFLDDVLPTKQDRAGLKKMLTTYLPIDGDVCLFIIRPARLTVQLQQEEPVDAELVDVLVHPRLIDGRLVARISVNAFDLQEQPLGRIVRSLGREIDVRLTVRDTPFFKTDREEGRPTASGA